MNGHKWKRSTKAPVYTMPFSYENAMEMSSYENGTV